MARSQQSGAGWWQRLAGGLHARRERQAATEALYRTVVGQAREPFLFAEFQVPDTREGRLEMVLLHAVLVLRRLQLEGEAGRALAQALFDLMFADIDQHMREWGVGDLSVGKQVKRVAESFYARAAAVEPALAAADAEALVPILTRNVYGGGDAHLASARRLAGYLVEQAAWLQRLPVDPRLGRLAFRPSSPTAPGPGDNALQKPPD